jgi:hypothetical protein
LIAVVRKKETSLCDFRGKSILVGFPKKRKKKKSLPTNPNFEDHANLNNYDAETSIKCTRK